MGDSGVTEEEALAIAEALTFHEGIGPERKQARLTYLRDRWAQRLLEHDRFRLHTSLEPGFACGIATVEIDGVDSRELADHLWETSRILVVGIKHPEFEGVRVSPSVFTTLEEIDRFAEAMETVARDGLPGFVLGNTAEKLVGAVSTSLLVVRPAMEPAALTEELVA